MPEIAADPAPAGRIVLVDDDELFRESLRDNLRDAGYDVADFSESTEALAYLLGPNRADLALLDWKMPGINGIDLLRRLREAGNPIPVMFLTVLSAPLYEETALAGGAVDFVDKSRSFGVIARRIALVLSRSQEPSSRPAPAGAAERAAISRKGALELDAESKRAYWKGVPVDLTLAEFQVVERMASRPGTDVRYRELYDAVRGEGFVAGYGVEGYRTNVRTFIRRIRQKFRAIDPEFDGIENYPGFGYRWQVDDHDRN